MASQMAHGIVPSLTSGRYHALARHQLNVCASQHAQHEQHRSEGPRVGCWTNPHRPTSLHRDGSSKQ